MPAQNVIVTANFVPLDHFTAYIVDLQTAPYIGEVVYLEDQFVALNATVTYAGGFGNPAEKQHGQTLTPIWNPDHHLTVYDIVYEEDPQSWQVEVENQFGTQNLTVRGPVALAVPTQKEGHRAPVGLDHFLLYDVMEDTSVEEYVGLEDQFGEQPEVMVSYPIIFANPVRKTHDGKVTEIRNPETHLVIYLISPIDGEHFVRVSNQFGEQALDLYGPNYLGVPSEKLSAVPR